MGRVYRIVLAALAAQIAWGQSQARVDFGREVEPLFQTRCRVCHTGEQAQGGLRLESREALLKGGASGAGVVPGTSAESLLVHRITGEQGQRMPPTGPPLTPAQIAVIRNWIDQGAEWTPADEGLAPLAPRQPALPAAQAAHPVDAFVAAHLERHGVVPGEPVSDRLFARRAYLDLWGLPPSPEELDSFVKDTSASKREALIDRLLANRANYAEHWISFWNDLLRNDEGVVYHGERKSITDWLLQALQTNMPYDRMVRSLLNPAEKDDPEGFLIGVNWRGVVSASQTPPMQAAQNSAQVFLGINLKCAACHDSFVNRWKLRDTFGLAAMFSDNKLELVRCDVPLGMQAEARFPIPELKVPFGPSLEARRAAAAEWFTHAENGRFARTLVNRYWRQLFGRGLVEPVDDMDAKPWDADLLDWLASDFAAHGYDLQHLLRRIMTSRAYQLPAVLETGPAREFVFRGPRLRRLTAEQFQDTISLMSGDWRLRVRNNSDLALPTREWRLKSDALSRVLGRPIRDQVYTERSTEATTLQALELTNGPLLSKRLERASLALLGELPPAPVNLFDSKMMRSGTAEVDIDIAGAKELWLLVEDVDSYDPTRVIAGWARAELTGPEGAVRLEDVPGRQAVARHEFTLKEGDIAGFTASLSQPMSWDLRGKRFTRFRATAVIDDKSRQSDINPTVRFFVFPRQPDRDRLVRVIETETAQKSRKWTAAKLTEYLYMHLLARRPEPGERKAAAAILKGSGAAGVEDLLWALLMSPEFQYIH